ncbi:hypothetical protein CP532_6693 [Ophiocordyceps camponoti-leonardi (nom. inval.)]|nr:hypothetical protein CP532_6693 [Ophiocordyceps camponoti-leonardi (nom. inval.)]
MPSTSHPRSPANTSRKTRPRSTQETAEEIQERLTDELKNANTQLNKVVSDRDRYQRLYEQLNQSLSDAYADKEELKNQVHSLKDDKAGLKKDLHALQKENEKLRQNIDAWDENYTYLERSRNELAAQLQAATSRPTPLKLPERPKVREQKDDRSSRERKAEKERLSRRFDDKRPARGPTNGFGDGWETAAVVSQGPARAYNVEATSPHVHYSSVPRTVNPGAYKVMNAGGGHLYQEAASYEDGNYHPHPLSR